MATSGTGDIHVPDAYRQCDLGIEPTLRAVK